MPCASAAFRGQDTAFAMRFHCRSQPRHQHLPCTCTALHGHGTRLPLPRVSTAFATKAPPLPCASTHCVRSDAAKTLPLPCASTAHRGRSTAAVPLRPLGRAGRVADQGRPGCGGPRRHLRPGPQCPPLHAAVSGTVILLHPPLRLEGVSIERMRECQQNDSLADGYPPLCVYTGTACAVCAC